MSWRANPLLLFCCCCCCCFEGWGWVGVTYGPVLGRHTCIINIKCWHCYCYHHHHHYHNPHQLTAVSFVRTVGTVLIAVTHVRLLNTDPVCALPISRDALVVDWTTDKSPSLSRVFTFIVNVFVSLHFHTPVASLHSSFSSLSFIFVITASHHFHHLQSPTGSVLFTVTANCIQRYRHIRSPQSSLTSSTLLLSLIIISSVQFHFIVSTLPINRFFRCSLHHMNRQLDN